MTESAGDLRSALKVVQQITEQLPEIPRKEVVLITDLQASMWTPESPAPSAMIPRSAFQASSTFTAQGA